MEIILGIFHNDMYRVLQSEKEWSAYPFEELGPLMEIRATMEQTIMLACNLAETVNFVLNDISLPLDPLHSVSCEELILITNIPRFLQKTKFWLGFQEIPKQEVLKLIELSTTINIDFKSTSFDYLLSPKI